MKKTKAVEVKKEAQIVFPKINGGFTTTLVIAEKFEIRHDRVIRKLEKLIKDDVGSLTHFGAVEYKDKKADILPWLKHVGFLGIIS